VSVMKFDQINSWIQNWIDEHSDSDAPEDILEPKALRGGAVSILQFARDAGLITQEEYQIGLNPIVQRTHPELGEEYFGTHGKRIRLREGDVMNKDEPAGLFKEPREGEYVGSLMTLEPGVRRISNDFGALPRKASPRKPKTRKRGHNRSLSAQGV